MACPAVLTGGEFLVRALAHLDCQAQTLGSFGFQSLAEAGSPAAVALTALLTLFVALYGIRLLFGAGGQARDLVDAVLKIGIVLTIAVSWPAWRVVAYDTVLYGPAEVASSIMPSTLPDPRAEFPQRLQAIDTGIAAFALTGTGRQNGAIIDEGPTSGFTAIALEDETSFGWSRPIFLATTIGSLSILRIAAGLLLALAPLLAGLMLFDFSRGLFAGWLRGLVMTALGSLGLTVLLSVEVAVIEPWLADVLDRRALGYATPAAPTELLALVMAFAIATAGLMFLLARVAFHNAWPAYRPVVARFRDAVRDREPMLVPASRPAELPVHSRAIAISESVAASVRRETVVAEGLDRVRRLEPRSPGERGPAPVGPTRSPEPLGSGYRRTSQREQSSRRHRDERG